MDGSSDGHPDGNPLSGKSSNLRCDAVTLGNVELHSLKCDACTTVIFNSTSLAECAATKDDVDFNRIQARVATQGGDCHVQSRVVRDMAADECIARDRHHSVPGRSGFRANLCLASFSHP